MRRVFVIFFFKITNTAAPLGDAHAIENVYFLLHVSMKRDNPGAVRNEPLRDFSEFYSIAR